jgi:Nucleoside 2-deoxyribosyltransferase like
MARILKPPAALVLHEGEQSVFVAGSIDMGRAEPWQSSVEQALADLPVVILNPRRDEWDSSWLQSITNPQFRGQVEWELEAQEQASVIAMYFAPATQAPITLLELGLFARSGRLLVCCPSGYWRRGNVEVVCARYGVPLFAELQQLVASVREHLNNPTFGRTLPGNGRATRAKE